jgi:hypothetical protein
MIERSYELSNLESAGLPVIHADMSFPDSSAIRFPKA